MGQEQPGRGFEGVVVGVDGSARDQDTIVAAAREAALRGWPLLMVHVEENAAPVLEVLAWTPTEGDSAGSAVLENAKILAGRTAPSVAVTTARQIGRPENALQELSQSAGLIVVGAGQRMGPAHFRYGTVSLNVAAHAHCPVLVVGEPVANARNRVVVGVDGSRQSVSAVHVAAEQARLRDARLALHTSWLIEVVDGLVVTEPGSEHWRQVEQRYRAMQEQVVADALGAAREGLQIIHEIVNGPSVDTLVEASKDADLLVVGNRGRGGFLGKLLGSVTMGVLQRSHCPVLVTREH